VTTTLNYLVDTGVFILYFRGDRRAVDFLRQTNAVIYYSRVTRKELLHPPIRARERREVLAFLCRHRLVNPDPQITEGFSSLLEKYPYLRDHLADALIAATAWTKGLEVVTTNPRHFEPIAEIRVRRFPEEPGR
jgi:predicted nucleic acid-binding protein